MGEAIRSHRFEYWTSKFDDDHWKLQLDMMNVGQIDRFIDFAKQSIIDGKKQGWRLRTAYRRKQLAMAEAELALHQA